jgi:hypothetical protein
MVHPNCGSVITDTHLAIVTSADVIRATVHYSESRQSAEQAVCNIQILRNVDSTNVARMSYLSHKIFIGKKHIGSRSCRGK